MKQYFLYFLTSLFVLYPLLFFWGFSAGPASLLPVFTLIASICLFLVASNVSLFSQKIGAAIGLVCLFIVLPWSVIILFEMFQTTSFDDLNWFAIIFFVPVFLVGFSIYYSIRFSILDKELDWDSDDRVKPIYRYLLLSLPIILAGLWIISIWDNFIWSG